MSLAMKSLEALTTARRFCSESHRQKFYHLQTSKKDIQKQFEKLNLDMLRGISINKYLLAGAKITIEFEEKQIILTKDNANWK